MSPERLDLRGPKPTAHPGGRPAAASLIDIAPLTAAAVSSFAEHGYLTLHRVIPPELLLAMQDECDRNLQLQLRDMDRVGTDTLGLTQRGRRYFLPDRFEESAALRQLLFSTLIEAIAVPLLGPDAFLLLDLFVVKSGVTGTSFAWHQDSGYLMGLPHRRYITLWCALDDMSEQNGTLRVLPYPRAGTRAIFPHCKDLDAGDLIGYTGPEPGEALQVERGSIIVLASDLLHCSGPNLSGAPRRAYVASITAEPVLDANGRPWNFAIPLVRNGRHLPAP